jgi:hypothetical protein
MRHAKSTPVREKQGAINLAVVIDVWLDPANRVRRAVRRFTIPGPRPAAVEIQNTFSGYVSAIAIERPPGGEPRGVGATRSRRQRPP